MNGMVTSAVTKDKVNKSRLEQELAFLFGKQVVEQSHKMSIAEMYAQAELMDDCISRLGNELLQGIK